VKDVDEMSQEEYRKAADRRDNVGLTTGDAALSLAF